VFPFKDNTCADFHWVNTIIPRPFASWESGSNENFNGLLRQYVPKKRPIKNIDHKEIKIIENRLNNRPRKRMGFMKPKKVFH
jgi:IS30 family transposase